MRTFFWTGALLAAAAFITACSSSSSPSGSNTDPSQDAGCYTPAADNDPACPATYAPSDLPASCAPVGLHCSYPGYGDEPGTNGCNEPAAILCVAPSSDASVGDAGADASAGTWVFGQ